MTVLSAVDENDREHIKNLLINYKVGKGSIALVTKSNHLGSSRWLSK